MSSTGPIETEFAKRQKSAFWQIKTKQHYKMWFSMNPHEFLNDENKLRFIRCCLDNPDVSFSFVYSSAILSEMAIENLKDFCQKLNIRPIDLNVDVENLLDHKLDSACYHLAVQEIMYAVKRQGGNLAAASDLIRWLPGLIECCGIYSDFDVELKFQYLESVISVKSAVILPTTLEFHEGELNGYTINNEFLAFAFEEGQPSCLAKDSIDIIRVMQTEMLTRYANSAFAMVLPVIPGFQNLNAHNVPLKIILNAFRAEHKDASIFELRHFIENLDFSTLCKTLYRKVLPKIIGAAKVDDFSEVELCTLIGQYRRKRVEIKCPDKYKHLEDDEIAVQFLKKLKNDLYKASVECVSGPFASMAVLKNRLESVEFHDSIFSHSREEQQPFIEAMLDSGLIENNLADCVFGQDFNDQHKLTLSDQSWTKDGAVASQNRSEIIRQAVIVIQRAIRSKAKETLSRAQDLSPRFCQ